MGISREVWDLRDGTPPNKEKPFQTRRNLSEQGKTFPSKEKPFRTRRNLSKQGKTPTNKGKPFHTRKTLSKQEKTPTTKKTAFQASRGYLPLKYRSFQVVGVFRQGKAVVSDGGYGVIGGRYCLLVWGDAEETKGKRWRRWRGVGPAGRPFPILLWR